MPLSFLIPVIISTLALIVSVTTAWFTFFRKGRIRMTQPTMIFFGPDGMKGPPKVFLRTLLHSTAKRGHVIEGMHLKLRRAESVQTFNVWVYGDSSSSLARGSGLYVGEQGIACNHHFLLPRDGTTYQFLSGEYIVEVYVSPIKAETSHLLSTTKVILSVEEAQAITQDKAGIFFDWGPDSRAYHSHIDAHPQKRLEKYLASVQV